jgi:hypothetical protein
MRVESAFAQSIPQPSVPKFTLEYTDGSYDVPTTQTTDPYTGQIITHQGYHVNLTVFEMIIQNQLNPINDLYYNIQVKGHYTNEWIMFFDFSEGLPLQDSSSQQTIIKMGTLDQDGLTLQGAHKTIPIPTGGKEDIQVQALIGNIGRNASAPLAPWTFYGTESDWSSTQTITVPSVSNSTSLNPTQTPIETANPTDNNAAGNGITLSITTIVLIIVITGLATSIASIFIYRRYQKSSNSSISKSL